MDEGPPVAKKSASAATNDVTQGRCARRDSHEAVLLRHHQQRRPQLGGPQRQRDETAPAESGGPVLPQLLQEGWEPVRETPMGGGASQLAHSLVLLERNAPKAKSGRAAKG